MRPIGRSLVVTAMVVATTVAVTTAEDSSSDESLRQALVLVDILKSGILRRSQRRFAATTGSLADFAGYRPWPPPEGPLYGYDPPFRRVNNQGDFGRRKVNNNTRQMDYEDPYGPHPGGDEPVTPEQATEGSTNPQTDASKQPPNKDKDASKDKDPTKVTENTVAVTKTKLLPKKLSDRPSRPASEAKTTKKSTPTKKNTKVTKSQISTAISPVKRKTKKPTKMNTKSKKKSFVNSKSTATGAPIKKGGIARLKSKKKSKAKNAIAHKRADEAEIAEAAMALQREAADVGNIARCVARRTPRPLRNATQTCSGSKCNEGNATQAASRFKATTRVYLSRSVRPRIPLPANNAFCYTNPENALCRTLI